MSRSRGLRRLGAGEAERVTLVAALLPTLTPGAPAVTLSMLAEAAGLSVSELSAEIDQLRSLGFAVEPVGHSGYRLTRPFDDLLVPEAVLSLLLGLPDYDHVSCVGLPYRYHARCASTNLLLKQQALGSPAGTLAVTDNQTEGRGRLGRSWESRPGEDLTFSVLQRPTTSPSEASLLSLAAALAVAEVLESVAGLRGRVGVKWPNDVLIDDKKVCGILLESSVVGEQLEWVVAGIGLNVNSDPAHMLAGLEPADRDAWRRKPQPTSLCAELGREVPRGWLLAELLVRLSLCWASPVEPELLSRLRVLDALRGRQLQVFAGPPDGALVVAGEAVGIGSQGELRVKDGAGRIVPVLQGK